ncbi:MAG: VOC family protein [Thermomicrobiales bacterium]
MARQIDHLVILVPSLETAIPDAITVGFTVVPGGRHASGGTENALIAFADGSYIELIAFIDPTQPSTNPWYGRVAIGGGFVDYAILSDDVNADVTRARAQGVTIEDTWAMGRDRLDGQRVEAVLAMPRHDGLPFVIQDLTPRSLRVPHDPAEIAHANGAAAISGVTILVPDLGAAIGQFAAVIGGEASSIEPPLPGIARAATILVGPDARQWICIAEPSTLSGDSGADATIPARYLQQYGAGPFAFTLSTASGAEPAPPGAGTLLDPARLGDTRCYLA